jgi:SAM-dependent methyltransferase
VSQEITAEHVQALSSIDDRDYWWYAIRRAHVHGHLRQAWGGAPCRYLDLGCGTGGMLASVIASLSPSEALGVDGTQQAVDIATTRGLPVRYADLRHPLELPFAPEAVSCCDVLEHLEDPVGTLRHLAAASAEDALLVVTVPAMPSLHSAWDDLCGHQRRYTRALLRRHLEEGGWSPRRVRYAFGYCVPPAFWQRRVSGRVQTMEFPPVAPPVNRVLTWMGRLERALGSPLPFGTSLVATARRAAR